MNLRKDNGGNALKAWKKLGPGLIQKPLRHIGNRINTKDAKGKIVFRKQYKAAYIFARNGNGDRVQQIARSLQS